MTFLKFKAEVLYTSHINICISNSFYCLTDVAVNIFFLLTTCTIEVTFIYIYLHSISLQSIEKINSIAFVTLFITLCILDDDIAQGFTVNHVWRLAAVFHISRRSKGSSVWKAQSLCPLYMLWDTEHPLQHDVAKRRRSTITVRGKSIQSFIPF